MDQKKGRNNKKKIATAAFTAVLVFGLMGCGAADFQRMPSADTTAATPTPAVTPAPTPTPVPELPAPTPKPVPAGDAMNIPEGEAGIGKMHDLDYDGINRSYMLYLPEGLSKEAPLVFVLHGYLGFASRFMSITGMNAAADKYHFGVVYPQGLSSHDPEFPGTHWNADFTFTDVNDVGFLTALAEYLQENYGFSKSETFAAGLSNGGFMCYTLAVHAPNTFRAIVSVAGTMSKGTWDDRDMTDASVPVLQIHGTADGTVPIDGTMTVDGGWGGAPPMDEIIDYWSDRDDAGLLTEETSGNITARMYTNSDQENLVWYYLIDGFGHNWPSVQTAGLDTGELIWRFFSQFIE